MTNIQFLKIIYWILASILIAFLLLASIHNYWNALLISLFLMPAALMVKYGIENAKLFTGFKRWLRYFFVALVSLYWGYIAITLVYWYFLELKAESLDKILINPIFIWILIGFFVAVEYLIFKKTNNKKAETILIYSERKKTVISKTNLAFIESRGDFTTAILIDGSEYKNAIKISKWETRLPDFIRIHRSFLVNPDYATLKGNEIVVHGKWNLPISRSYKPSVHRYFN